MKKHLITIFATVFIFTIFFVPFHHQVFADNDDHSKPPLHTKSGTHSKKKTVSTKKAVKTKKVKKTSPTKIAVVPTVTIVPPTPMASYTLTTVALHNTAASCWTTISGNVYDFTPWIKEHSSTQKTMLSLCGTDSTTAFNVEYAGKSKPAEQLKAFLIGKLQ